MKKCAADCELNEMKAKLQTPEGADATPSKKQSADDAQLQATSPDIVVDASSLHWFFASPMFKNPPCQLYEDLRCQSELEQKGEEF